MRTGGCCTCRRTCSAGAAASVSRHAHMRGAAPSHPANIPPTARLARLATAASPGAAATPPPTPPSLTYDAIVSAASAELASTLAAVDPAATAAAVDAIAASNRVVTVGVGREGLAMKGLAMRLFHAGLAASTVGEMTTPPVGRGDLLVASAGPGHFSTVAALAGAAQAAGARTLVVTAQPTPSLRVAADVAVRIPARTMAEDHRRGEGGGGGGPSEAPPLSVLPLGSAYELALQLWCDAVAALVSARVVGEGGGGGADLAARHTNLE